MCQFGHVLVLFKSNKTRLDHYGLVKMLRGSEAARKMCILIWKYDVFLDSHNLTKL